MREWLLKRVLGVVWDKTNGWKSVASYFLLQIPGVSANPMAMDAMEKMLANPNWQTIVYFAGNLLLLLGVTHRIVKNVKGGTK